MSTELDKIRFCEDVMSELNVLFKLKVCHTEKESCRDHNLASSLH
jgi:hypothetical protein